MYSVAPPPFPSPAHPARPGGRAGGGRGGILKAAQPPTKDWNLHQSCPPGRCLGWEQCLQLGGTFSLRSSNIFLSLLVSSRWGCEHGVVERMGSRAVWGIKGRGTDGKGMVVEACLPIAPLRWRGTQLTCCRRHADQPRVRFAVLYGPRSSASHGAESCEAGGERMDHSCLLHTAR